MKIFTSLDANWRTGVVWITCGLLWCFNQLFGLSFWRHPFTAEHPLVSKWCNAEFLHLCSAVETHLHLGWPEGEYIFSKCFTFVRTFPLKYPRLHNVSTAQFSWCGETYVEDFWVSAGAGSDFYWALVHKTWIRGHFVCATAHFWVHRCPGHRIHLREWL